MKAKHRLMTAIAAAMLGACATPVEIMQKPADAKATLKQRPEMAAACVARNIDRRATNIISDRRPTANGWELISRVTGDAVTVYLIAQFSPSDTGSVADIWTPGLFAFRREKDLKVLLNGC